MTIRPFTPAQEAPGVLDRRTVGRGSLLTVLARRLREAATTATRQHTLLVGPRGSGKTHLLRVAEYRAGGDPAVADGLLFTRVAEDAVGVTSYAALLRQLCTSARIDAGRERDPATLERLILDRAGGRTVVVVIENLDRVFRSIGLAGQRDLRSWVETTGRVFLLTATPALFDAVKERDKPWFGGLIVTPVEGLSAADGRDLLTRLALDRDDQPLVALLQSDRGEARVRAVSRLTAGSARIWMVLSECLTVENLTELIPAIEALVESLVPYYQSLVWDLPDNHQAIVQQLAEGASAAMTAKELAAETGLSEQTVSKSLSLLQEGRWVRGEKLRSGDQRQTWYSLREPMLRHHFQWRATQGEPLRLIVELLREWYAVGELRRHLASVEAASPGAGYLAESLRLNPPAYDLAMNTGDPVTVRAVAREWMRGDDAIYPAECGLWVELCIDLDHDPTADVEAAAARWRERYPHLPAVDARMLADLTAAASGRPGLTALVRAAADQQSGDARTGLLLVVAGLGGRANPAVSRDLLASLESDSRSPLGLAVLVDRAFWTAQSGNPAAALDTVAALLPALTEVLGADHAVTLTARSNLAGYTGEAGDAPAALRLFQELAADSDRVLGPDDRATLSARAQVAYYTREAGDAPAALRLFQELAADSDRVLGPDESLARSARESVALWSMIAGKADRLTRLLQDARAGDEVSRMRLPAELRPLVDDDRDA